MLVTMYIHGYNPRYTAKENTYKPSIPTNVGKQSISFMVTDIWKDLPTHLKTHSNSFKNPSVPAFLKKIICLISTVRQQNEINFHLAEEATNFMLKFFLLCYFFAQCISFDFTCYLNVEPNYCSRSYNQENQLLHLAS